MNSVNVDVKLAQTNPLKYAHDPVLINIDFSLTMECWLQSKKVALTLSSCSLHYRKWNEVMSQLHLNERMQVKLPFVFIRVVGCARILVTGNVRSPFVFNGNNRSSQYTGTRTQKEARQCLADSVMRIQAHTVVSLSLGGRSFSNDI